MELPAPVGLAGGDVAAAEGERGTSTVVARAAAPAYVLGKRKVCAGGLWRCGGCGC